MNLDITELIELKAVRDARKSFQAYVRYTTPGYVFGWFNELLCEALQEFYREVEAGNSPRYMIFAPPRAGKSELASRAFPAWVLGQDNSMDFMGTSYSSDLANMMSRDVLKRIEDERHLKVFPDTKVVAPNTRSKSGAVRSVDTWDIINSQDERTGGMYRAAGVTGGITGRGFRIGLIDDPVKDWVEATSKTIQEKVWEWYQSTFYTRRNPEQNGIIIIMTRWSPDDLCGRLLKAQEDGGDKWKVLRFPMVADEDEYVELGGSIYHTRKAGDILFPERMDEKFVESCKQGPEIFWNSLYQQRPTIKGGNFFKHEFWKFYADLPSQFNRIIITADTAMKTGEQHDYSVFQVWGYSDGKIYLIDVIRGKWEAHALKQVAKQVWASYGRYEGIKPFITRASCIYVEDKASGTGLIQELRQEGVPCIGVQRTKDKVTRAIDKQPSVQAGLVWLPQKAPWLSEFLSELEEFSLDMTHKHDDQVDAMLDAIDILVKGAGGVNFAAMAS